jgi:hypothetical protein
VMAKEGDTYKFIRFGQQGVKVLARILPQRRIRHVRSRIMLGIMHRANRPASYQQSTGHTK